LNVCDACTNKQNNCQESRSIGYFRVLSI
jgi:hypothetical protein